MNTASQDRTSQPRTFYSQESKCNTLRASYHNMLPQRFITIIGSYSVDLDRYFFFGAVNV